MSVPLSRRSSHLDVTFYVNLQGTPTGHVVLGREVLALEQARDIHRRLGVALARLDAVIAANTERKAPPRVAANTPQERKAA